MLLSCNCDDDASVPRLGLCWADSIRSVDDDYEAKWWWWCWMVPHRKRELIIVCKQRTEEQLDKYHCRLMAMITQQWPAFNPHVHVDRDNWNVHLMAGWPQDPRASRISSNQIVMFVEGERERFASCGVIFLFDLIEGLLMRKRRGMRVQVDSNL